MHFNFSSALAQLIAPLRYKCTLAMGRPYFGTHHRAFQGAPIRFAYMLETVRLLPPKPRILEVGSWVGGSALTWAEGISRFHQASGSVLCVDPWEPYSDSEDAATKALDLRDRMANAARDGTAFRLFQHNVTTSPHGHLIQYRRARSTEVLPALPAASFDLIYIDGSHRYEDVRFDLQQAKRLAVEGGIICGDDLDATHDGVVRAVADEFGNVSCWHGYFATRRLAGPLDRVELPVTRALPSHLRRYQRAIARVPEP